MDGKLQIKLFGGFHISSHGEPVPGMHSKRLQTLLSYLVLHPDFPQSRQYLAFIFWPDSTESRSLNNLRQVLHLLRKKIPDLDSFLQVNNQNVHWLTDSNFTLDVAEFDQLIHQTEEYANKKNNKEFITVALERAVDLYQGDLFPQCYDNWIEPLRFRLKEQYKEALGKLICLHEQARSYPKAIRFAERLLAADNLREKTYLDLMRLHALNRDRTKSIKVYHQCEKVLFSELDMKPGSDTRDFYKQLINNEPMPADLKTGDLKADKEVIPLVGRQEEWKIFKEIWDRVSGSNSHFLIISGEAGIGKTRFAREMEQWASAQKFVTASARCYAAENSLAYTPVNQWLRVDGIRQRVKQLDRVYLTEISRILPELLIDNPELPAPQAITDSWQRRNFLEALAEGLLTADYLTLLFIDDLQWCDQETLKWIHFLLNYRSKHPLLIAGTARIQEVSRDHELRKIAHSLQREEKITEIELNPLNADETGSLAEKIYGGDLDEDFKKNLYKETEGNPFFLIESIHTLVDERDAEQKSGLLPHLTNINRNRGLLPDRVQNVIRSRFAMISEQANEVSSCAAVIGRKFNPVVLTKITGYSDDELQPILDELLHRRILREQDDHELDFSHDKFREFAYSSLHPDQKSRLHEKIALAFLRSPEMDPDTESSRIAFHFDKAGQTEKAIEYYEKAANFYAQHIFALREAYRLLTRALELLMDHNDKDELDPRELSLRLKLGPLVVAIKGYHTPVAREFYQRIQILSSRLGQNVSPPVLRSMAISCICGGSLEEALRLGDQILEVGHHENRTVLKVEGHYAAGASSFWLGDYPLSRKHLQQAIDHYDPGQEQAHIDYFVQHPRVICQIRLGLTLLYMGYPDQANVWQKKSLDEARTYGHPFSLAYSLCYGSIILGEQGDLDKALKLADECVKLCDERGFTHFFNLTTFFQYWLQHSMNPSSKWIDAMEQRIYAMRETGLKLQTPYYTSLLACAYLDLGDTETALLVADRALNYTEERGETWSHSEILRIKGIILEQTNDPQEAKILYLKAKDIAKKQRARLLELRAAINLFKLYQKQGEADRAEKKLRTIYKKFTEGHSIPDLIEAAHLLKINI